MQATIKTAPPPDVLRVEGKSCLKCVHAPICTVLRGVKPVMDTWQPEDRPFEAIQLANICAAYIPIDDIEFRVQP